VLRLKDDSPPVEMSFAAARLHLWKCRSRLAGGESSYRKGCALMRWIVASLVFLAVVAAIAGCGGGTSPPSPPPVVGSYLADAFMSAFVDPVANLGLVVREQNTVEGAGFFSAPVSDVDVFFSGTIDTAGTLHATGRLIGNGGTQDVGAFTMTGTIANFPDGSNIQGTFTAQGIGSGSGTWRAFIFTVPPLGAYVGTFSGDRQGMVALMNFALDDSVMMNEDPAQPQLDYFASDLGSLTLTPPTVSGGPYGLSASNGLYNTGFSFTGTVGQLEATGTWEQPAATPLAGTWLGSRPASRTATTRAVAPGPIRVHRKKH
jgi:hypothetical protein